MTIGGPHDAVHIDRIQRVELPPEPLRNAVDSSVFGGSTHRLSVPRPADTGQSGDVAIAVGQSAGSADAPTTSDHKHFPASQKRQWLRANGDGVAAGAGVRLSRRGHPGLSGRDGVSWPVGGRGCGSGARLRRCSQRGRGDRRDAGHGGRAPGPSVGTGSRWPAPRARCFAAAGARRQASSSAHHAHAAGSWRAVGRVGEQSQYVQGADGSAESGAAEVGAAAQLPAAAAVGAGQVMGCKTVQEPGQPGSDVPGATKQIHHIGRGRGQ